MTSRYCGEEAAKQAEEEFERVFAQKGAPDEMTRLRWPCQDAQVPLIDLLARLSIAKSKADARRTIEQGGVSLDGARVTDPLIRIDISSPREVQIKVGKRGFYIRLPSPDVRVNMKPRAVRVRGKPRSEIVIAGRR